MVKVYKREMDDFLEKIGGEDFLSSELIEIIKSIKG